MRVLVIATVLLALGPPGAFAQVPTGGPEIPLNVTTAGDQVFPAIAVESDGGFIAAWRNGTSAIAARRLDAAAAPRSGEIAVNVSPAAPDARPAVAAFPGGGFVVVWHAPDASGQGIVLRRFDAAGQPLAGEVAVNLATAGDQKNPRIAAGPLGYVVSWTSGTAIVGRLLSGMGTPLGVEIPVGTGGFPAGAWRGNGLVFAWSDTTLNGTLYVRLFDSAGAPLGPPTVANGANPPMPCCFPFYHRRAIGIAQGVGGAFTVSWDLFATSAAGGLMPFFQTHFGSYVRRYDAAGAPLGPESLLNTYSDGAQQDPSVGIAPAGRWLAAWSSVPEWEGCSGVTCLPPAPDPVPQDGSSAGVYARLLDAAGTDVGGGEFRVNVTTAGDQRLPAVAMTDTGAVVAFQGPDAAGTGIYARRFAATLVSAGFEVDPTDEAFSDGNRVLENWEAAVAAPAWRNTTGAAQALTSTATTFTGPAGPTYAIVDGAADFGVIPDGVTRSCRDVGNCFLLGVSGARPAAHWDAQLTETAPPPFLFAPRTRAVHIGDSFFDVPRGGPYRFVETVFHNDVMAPCAAGYFCPSWGVTRETMAQFVLKALNPSFVPPPCVAGGERFVDVPASSPYCPWIEELARRGVVAGCGGGAYCPLAGVSRETMAVYLLLTKEGTGYTPPACTAPVFNDVPASSPFCRWIEELARRGIVAGCGGGAYCPFLGVARDQMSVFLTGTFGLLLYAP